MRTPTRPAGHSDTGFTLIEMMVTVAIIAILAALTLNGVAGLRPRAKAGTAAADLSAALQAARQQALGDSTYVYVRWLNDPGLTFSGFVVCSDPDARYRPPVGYSFNQPCGTCTLPGCPAPTLEAKSALPIGVVAASGTDFGPTTDVPSVFKRAVTLSAVGATGCSFCADDSNQVGWILFLPNGETRFQGDTHAVQATGGAILIQSDPAISKTHAVYATIVTAPFGLVRSFVK